MSNFKERFDSIIKTIIESTGETLLENNSFPLKLEEITINNFHPKKNDFVLISGPNGVGKDTISRSLGEKGIPRLPNVYTRTRRPTEIDGVDAIFLSVEEFKGKVKNGEVIDAHLRHESDWHGFDIKSFKYRISRDQIFHIDKSIPAHKRLKTTFKGYNYLAIYILPPSFEEWYDRLAKRSENNPHENLNERIKTSLNELEDSVGLYDVYVVNETGKIEQTVEKILNLLKK